MVLHTRGRVGSRRFSEEETLQAIVCKVSLHLLILPGPSDEDDNEDEDENDD